MTMADTTSPPSSEPRHRTIILGQGDFHFGQGRTRISTLLGSCVSITLWHPHRRIGGMCHYMLCERQREAQQALDGRFAAEAFQLFLQAAERSRTSPSDYIAKLFGGANMFPGNRSSNAFTTAVTTDIGKTNIDYGRELLAHQGIRLIAEHVGGSGARKLHFDLWSGDVWLSFAPGQSDDLGKPPKGGKHA